MPLYRASRIGGHGEGWLEAPYAPGFPWRPATRRERIWHALFWERFSWVEWMAFAAVTGWSHDSGWPIWTYLFVLVAAFVAVWFVRAVTRP